MSGCNELGVESIVHVHARHDCKVNLLFSPFPSSEILYRKLITLFFFFKIMMAFVEQHKNQMPVLYFSCVRSNLFDV